MHERASHGEFRDLIPNCQRTALAFLGGFTGVRLCGRAPDSSRRGGVRECGRKRRTVSSCSACVRAGAGGALGANTTTKKTKPTKKTQKKTNKQHNKMPIL